MSKEKQPRARILPVAVKLLEALRDSCERIELAGSLRRETPEVGDIEIVAIPNFGVLSRESERDVFGQETVNEIRGNLLWARLDVMGVPYTKRGDKYRQFAFDGIQVDLFTAERGNFGWIYLIRTGSAEFSHRMAATLNLRGYTSEGGYIRHSAKLVQHKRIETPEEKNVFHLTGLPWVDPKNRTH